MQSGICTLLELGYDIFLSEMVGKCIDVFQDPQLKNVTSNDYGIMLTAEDEVYNNPLAQRYLIILGTHQC